MAVRVRLAGIIDQELEVTEQPRLISWTRLTRMQPPRSGKYVVKDVIGRTSIGDYEQNDGWSVLEDFSDIEFWTEMDS